ncbi:uncharacterized protein EDB93DRAFT_1108514 [Suillus bovinus]|uniref:uncharacterized protein n=1 Tax=Suillus bovinus TaxID=48563 RepID=UPI001B8708FD|nr:uncharacterized protein EDB93DRAFT_1108514 [Suillus bovinus]KAG2130163.1 hypothetical protein EDB93DRAFT_1108514 [Suillus bovinus]
MLSALKTHTQSPLRRMSEELLSRMKRSSSYPPSTAFNNAIAANETSAAIPRGRTRSFKLLLKFKDGMIERLSVLKITPFAAKEGVVPKSVVVQDQSTPPDVKEGVVPAVASQVQNTRSHMNNGAEAQSAAVALQVAREDTHNLKTLGGHETKVLSTVRDGPAYLNAAGDFQNTYLKPLRIFDSVIEKIADIHPYAKMALGALSCASKSLSVQIVLAQVDRDEAVLRLVDKVAEVYDFMLKEETLGQISSMHDIRLLEDQGLS